MTLSYRYFLIAITLIASPFAYSADQPSVSQVTDAEIIRQQQRIEDQLRSVAANDVRLDAVVKKIKTDIYVEEAPCFPINAIDLKIENKKDELESDFLFALKDIKYGRQAVLGKCLGTISIRNVAEKIQNELIAKGYITTLVDIKNQDLNAGKLIVSVYLGRVNNLLKTTDSSQHAQLYNALPIRKGNVLNLRQIEQGLENFRRLSGIDVDIQIVPATGGAADEMLDGYSDLLVKWQQDSWFNASFSVDDSGSESSGKYLGSFATIIENPFLLNDVLNAGISYSLKERKQNNNRNYYTGYKLPYGNWLLSGFYSNYHYEQTIAGFNGPIIYSGTSKNFNIDISRLLSRGQSYKTYVHYKFYGKETRTFIDDLEIMVQRRKTAGWQAGLNHRQFLGNATLDVGVDYQRGTGAMHALKAPEAVLGQGKSRPMIWSADVNFVQPFQFAKQPLQYRLNWRGQRTPSVLSPQDRFSIGGRYSVRGFDGEYSLAGDNGHLLQQELGWSGVIPNSQLYTGLDQGWISGPSAKNNAGQYLSGMVLGLRTYYKGVALDAFAGHGIQAPRGFEKGFNSGFSLSWSY